MVVLLFALWGSVFTQTTAFAGSVDQLYDNASDGSPAISLIHSAQTSLDLEIYTMKDPAVIAELKAAMARGVKLRILQTPNPVLDSCPVFKISNSNTSADCVALRDFVVFVNTQGGQYLPFSMKLCGRVGSSCYQHGKMIIADQSSVMISTGNLDPSNLCDVAANPAHCNRDFSVVSTDEQVIQTFGKIFENDFLGEAYDLEAVLGEDPRITASPDSLKPLLDFISSAVKSIQVENQYLNDPTVNAALIAAANRGVKVFVMVSSVTAFGKLNPAKDGSKINHWTANFTAYDQANINSRIFDDQMTINGQLGYLHAKVILVDGVHAWIGSVNGSTKSLTQNREFGIFSDDAVLVKHLSDVLYADFTDRNSETWQQSLVCKKDACGHSQATSPVLPGETSSKHKKSLEDESSKLSLVI
jgi:cardiolipin synthase